MQKQVIHSDKAPAAVGPYSQAVRVGDFVYTAGQIGLDPGSGALVAGGVVEQTRQALRNLQAVLEAAGTSLDYAVKTTVFVQNMGDFAVVNQEYGRHFSGSPPARSTVEVAALPLGALVEIEAVAVVPSVS